MINKQRLINVSNRLPIKLDRSKIEKSSGGLVAALDGIQDEYEFVWIGWLGNVIQSESRKEIIANTLKEKYNYLPVFLNKSEVDGYYHGFSNAGLWPLLHYMSLYTVYEEKWFNEYRKANEKFADAVLEIANDGDLVWVHDYHLFLLPSLLKKRRPSLKIGFFLHTPFPSYEIFRCHPNRKELLKGLLGADLIGFHTFGYLRHFRSAILRILGVESEINNFSWKGYRKQIGVFPIGINWKSFEDTLQTELYQKQLTQYKDRFGGKKIVLSVERLDYSKGIPRRLQAIEHFLKNYPEEQNTTIFLFIAVPSRESVEKYKDIRDEILHMVGHINGQYTTLENVPIHFINRAISFHELCALYSLADVCLVTPLIDGMNLVAKEYIACQTSENGVLILSEFAGAAQELFNAIQVNPYDIQDVSSALYHALHSTPQENKENIAPMRSRIIKHNATAWAESFIHTLVTTYDSDTTQQKTKRPGKNIVDRFAFSDLKKALFLDYDGSLREFEKDPKAAVPSDFLRSLFELLAQRSDFDVYIISGRKPEFLDEHLGRYGFSLIGEHGYVIKSESELWSPLHVNIDLSWKDQVREIFELFTLATPGSSIEEKTSSIVWHYRKADPEFGYWKAGELIGNLTEIISNMPVEVHHGKKIVEVNSQLINKGKAIEKILEQKSFETILCIGDDQTDETMFKLRDRGVITIKVGKGDTEAEYRLSAPKQVHQFLHQLVSTQ